MNASLRLISILTIVMACAACNQPGQRTDDPVIAVSHLADTHFSSVLAAVIAAGNRYNPISIAEDREYMGAILRHDNAYRYTVAQGQAGADTISLRLAIPHTMEVVAYWHTHGAQHFSRKYFSDIDSALVRQSGKPFYMANYTGVLQVLQPDHHTLPTLQAARLGLGRNSGYAEGNKVLGVHGLPVRIATTRTAALVSANVTRKAEQ